MIREGAPIILRFLRPIVVFSLKTKARRNT